MNVLIIDDTDYKIHAMQDLISSLEGFSIPWVARSFHGGVHLIRELRPDIVLLDMTLPTFETSDGQSEGRMRIYGGRDILAEMAFDQLASNVIVITQFDHFGEPPKSLDREQLFKQLRESYPDLFVDGLYYSNMESSWLFRLERLLLRLKQGLR